MLTQLTSLEFCLLLLGAAGIGVSKSGFAGVSLLHVLIFAFIFEAKSSTGVLLPLLVVGDIFAIGFFGRTAEWKQIRKLLPATLGGVLIGVVVMKVLDETLFRQAIAAIIIILASLQSIRIWRPEKFQHLPHSVGFAWSLGLLAGVTTMMANAAGPIVALYLLAVSMPKLELVGTSAWLFLILNVFKLPFSFSLGFIDVESLLTDLALIPGIPLGMLLGRWLIHRISQKLFDSLLLAFTGLAALRLLGVDQWLISQVTSL